MSLSRQITDALAWIYGADSLLRDRRGLAYPLLVRPCRLTDPEEVLAGRVPDDRTFPASSPLLERFQGSGARLWNGRTWVLRELDPAARWPRLRCSPGRYFDALNTCSMLREELAEAVAAERSPALAYRRMRRRHELHRGKRGAEAVAQAWSGEGRSAAIGISCLFSVRGGDGYLYCVQRRSLALADDPGAYHVVPSMVFQPAELTEPTEDKELDADAGFSVTATVLRELGEELFSADTGGAAAALAEEALAGLRRRLADGRAELLVSGVALNLLDLRPEILTLLAVHDGDWLRRHGPAIQVAASEYRDDPDHCAQRAGTRAFQPLEEAAALGPDGLFHPSRSVPGGAAAMILGLPLLARLLAAAAEATARLAFALDPEAPFHNAALEISRDEPMPAAAGETCCEPSAPPLIPEIQPLFEPDRRLIHELHRILASGQVTNGGPHLREFERLTAEFLQVAPSQVAAVANGADAIVLSLRVLGGQEKGGKAVLPSYTFLATLNAVVECGLEPVFCDLDPRTFTLSPGALDDLLRRTRDVRFVLPVNVFGVPPDLAALRAVAERYGAALVYDNAHGFGTEVHGVRAPLEPLAQSFSFHATKLLPAGEGGLVLSRDENLVAEVKRLRNHGIAADLLRSTPGVNAKLDELRAALGVHALRRVTAILERRRRYGERLRAWFERDELKEFFTLQHVPPGVATNFQNFGVLCAPGGAVDLDTVLQTFRSLGVGCRSYFNPALHHLELYRGRFELPATDRVWRSLVSLPLHSRMAEPVLARIEQAAATVARELAGERQVASG